MARVCRLTDRHTRQTRMQTSRQIWSIPGEYDYSELPLAMLNESLKVSLKVLLLSSSFSGSLRLDNPAGLIIRLLFGFVKLNKNENQN